MRAPKNKYLFIVPAALLFLVCLLFLPARHNKASVQSTTHTSHSVDRHLPPHHTASWLRRFTPGSSLALTPPQFMLDQVGLGKQTFPLPLSAGWLSADMLSLPLRGPPSSTLFL